MEDKIKALYTTNSDAKYYYIESMLELVIIFSVFFCYWHELIPLWLMIVILCIAYPRYVIMQHELFHIAPVERFGFIVRSFLIPLSPFNLGYREYVQVHNAHHRGPATEHDLDAFQIKGNRFKSFLGALFSPEIHFFKWIFNNDIHSDFILEALARILVFASLAILAGIKFLWFWLSLKLIYGAASFVFFNLVHYRHGQYGTFETPLPEPIKLIAELIWGKTLVRAVMFHNVHHENVRICAQHLQTAKSVLDT